MKNDSTLFGVVSLVLSLVSPIFLFFPPVAILLSILAIVFGVLQQKKRSNGLAIAGLVIGSIGLVIAIIFLIIGILFVSVVTSDEFAEELSEALDEATREAQEEFEREQREREVQLGNLTTASIEERP